MSTIIPLSLMATYYVGCYLVVQLIDRRNSRRKESKVESRVVRFERRSVR